MVRNIPNWLRVAIGTVILIDLALSSCLWIGLSMGCVVCMGLQIPSADKRLTDPVSRLSDGKVSAAVAIQ